MSDNTHDLSPDIRRQLEQIRAEMMERYLLLSIEGTDDSVTRIHNDGLDAAYRLATERAAQIEPEYNSLLWLILLSTRQNFGTNGEAFLREKLGLAAAIRGQEQR